MAHIFISGNFLCSTQLHSACNFVDIRAIFRHTQPISDQSMGYHQPRLSCLCCSAARSEMADVFLSSRDTRICCWIGSTHEGKQWRQWRVPAQAFPSESGKGGTMDQDAPPPEWKEWQARKKEEEMLVTEGIAIRRRPPTGPPQHHVGPFEFRIQSEGNTPRNKLEEIIWNKDVEVTQMKEKMPLHSILKALPNAPPPRDFVGALRKRAAESNVPALIAEVKKASPSRGVIQPNFDPVRIAQAYEEGGAACISVLTDNKYFQGEFEYLKRVRNAGVQCPLLCKEFIIDAWQLYFARLHGADAVLLIAAVLPDQDLKYMSKICKNLGITALVEVHNIRELDRVLGIDGIDLIGINNRDLETFEVDINTTVELLKEERGSTIRERNILVVGESGLFTPQDIALLQNAGVNAVLVGESLVKQDDPVAGIADLFGKDISLSRHGGTHI